MEKNNGGLTPTGRPMPLNKMISAMAGRELCYAKDPTCGTEAFDEHTCPFQSDVNDDHEYKCRCCEACQNECAMDI